MPTAVLRLFGHASGAPMDVLSQSKARINRASSLLPSNGRSELPSNGRSDFNQSYCNVGIGQRRCLIHFDPPPSAPRTVRRRPKPTSTRGIQKSSISSICRLPAPETGVGQETGQFAAYIDLTPRLGVADHALDGRIAPAQAALDGIDQIMDGADRKCRVHAAVEIDDFAIGGFADAYVMHFAEAR